jgi:menaquinone C8-methyltransferase
MISYKNISQIKWNYQTTIASNLMEFATSKFLNLEGCNEQIAKSTDDNLRLLYIHIPFCVSLCPYCSFHKFLFDETTSTKYFELLRCEMKMVYDLGYKFDSIYFGGGTTTILPAELGKTIDYAKSLFDIKEISCESTPMALESLISHNLHTKIDRLSVGIQTFNDEYLKQIQRYKKFGSAHEQYEKVRNAMGNFKTINIDMIYNYPTQSEEELSGDIETILKLKPNQVTFYPLMYSPALKKTLIKQWGETSKHKEAKLYKLILEKMKAQYTQRSSWAWSLQSKDIIDEYVIERAEYIGIGSGAFSFVGDKLYANTFSLRVYEDMITKGKLPITHSTTFPKRAIKQYRMMVELFGLRKSDEHLYFEELLLKFYGAFENNEVSAKGAFLFSILMKEFYNGMDNVRATMRSKLQESDGLL